MSSDDDTPDGDKKMSSRSIAEVIADGSGDDNDSSIDDSDNNTIYYDSSEDHGSDEDNDKGDTEFMGQFLINNDRNLALELRTSYMDDNTLLGGFGSALANSKRMVDDFMNELKRKPLSSGLLYTTLRNKLMDLKNKRGKYIVNRLHSSESERLAECSLNNDDDYMDYDDSSVWSTEVSYEIVIPVFIKMLEENKGKLQDASRVDFIRLIQRIVNDIINRGDGYEVRRWGNKKGYRNEWKRVDEDEEDNDDSMKPRVKKNLHSKRGRVDEDEGDNDDSMKPRAKKNLHLS